MLPEIGKVYTSKQGISVKVTRLTNLHVYYTIEGVNHSAGARTIFSFMKKYMPDVNPCNEIALDKPLDKAFKQLDKQFCLHKNIREDRFFSAMVYKTCKDCGQPLN